MADNSALEITLGADNKDGWTIIETADFVGAGAPRLLKGVVVFILACRHLQLNVTKPKNFELSSGDVLNVSCTF